MKPSQGPTSTSPLLVMYHYVTLLCFLTEERQGQQKVDKQQKQLQSAMQKVTHLAELLHESEANCVWLGDQAKLLKEEIRRYHLTPSHPFSSSCYCTRLERNQERHESVSNMEYLKKCHTKGQSM